MYRFVRFNDGDTVRVIRGENRGYMGKVIASSEEHGINVYTVKSGDRELPFVEADLQPWEEFEATNEVAETVKKIFLEGEKEKLDEPLMFDMAFETGMNKKESKKRIRITKETLDEYKEQIARTDTHGMPLEIVRAYENVCVAMRKAIEAERRA